MNPLHKEFYLRPLKAPSDVQPFSRYRKWPKFGSIKYDGFRNISVMGVVNFTPSLKDHVNQRLTDHFGDFFRFLGNLRLVADGEFFSYDFSFDELKSRIRSHNGNLDGVQYYVFDLLSIEEWLGRETCSFRMRHERLHTLVRAGAFPNVLPVGQFRLDDPVQAQLQFDSLIENGEEGMMMRDPDASYIHKVRTTHDEEQLLKAKFFETADARIIGFNQMQRLCEGAEERLDPDGILKRSYRAEDYEPAPFLGSFIVQDELGRIFNVGPGKGHTWEQRKDWWLNRNNLLNQWIEYIHMPHGAKDAPRIGRLVRFREPKA